MRKLPHKQKGLGFLGWLFILVLVLFFVLLGLKLVPTYVEHHSIKNVMASLEREPGIRQQTRAQIWKLIRKRLRINNVYDFDERNLKIEKREGRLRISVKYEVRKPMVGNIDVVMSFQDDFLI